MTVAACASSGQAAANWLSGTQASAEYRDEARGLTLAPGWDWPADLDYPDKVDGDDIAYEKNTGRIDAGLYWYCSWALTYVEADTDADRTTALRQVLRLRETKYYQIGVATDNIPMFDAALDSAGDDDTKLRRLIGITCSDIKESKSNDDS
ncbi:hypothetical protein [Actinoplanes sp. NPDC051851]|uniref:hypothetical protein n=1 Tax=Actinoplanes sp. NPDC051851 TaxID=3154753 RepID=UPI003435A681